MQNQTLVVYSYYDKMEGKRITSSPGITIDGAVTPARVMAAVGEKWEKTGYKDGVTDSIEIVHVDSVTH